jgi:hypothetical protein
MSMQRFGEPLPMRELVGRPTAQRRRFPADETPPPAMRFIMLMLFTTSLLACAGCDGNGSAQAAGTGNHGHGLVKIGIPF